MARMRIPLQPIHNHDSTPLHSFPRLVRDARTIADIAEPADPKPQTHKWLPRIQIHPMANRQRRDFYVPTRLDIEALAFFKDMPYKAGNVAAAGSLAFVDQIWERARDFSHRLGGAVDVNVRLDVLRARQRPRS